MPSFYSCTFDFVYSSHRSNILLHPSDYLLLSLLQKNGAQVIEVIFSKEEEIRVEKTAKDIWESAQALTIAIPTMAGMNVRRNQKRTRTRKQKQAVYDRESTGEDDDDEADDEMNTAEEVDQGEDDKDDDQEEEHEEEHEAEHEEEHEERHEEEQ